MCRIGKRWPDARMEDWKPRGCVDYREWRSNSVTYLPARRVRGSSRIGLEWRIDRGAAVAGRWRRLIRERYHCPPIAAHIDEDGNLSHVAFHRLRRDTDGVSVFLDEVVARTRLNGVRAVGRLLVADVQKLGMEAAQTPPDDPHHAGITSLPFIDADTDEERLLAERLTRQLAATCVTVWRRK